MIHNHKFIASREPENKRHINKDKDAKGVYEAISCGRKSVDIDRPQPIIAKAIAAHDKALAVLSNLLIFAKSIFAIESTIKT